MFSFILFEGLKFNLLSSGIIYESFVFGFLPRRSGVFLKLKEPKPLNLTDLNLDLFLISNKNDSNIIVASPEETKDFLLIFFIILVLLKFIYLFTFLELKFHQFLKIDSQYHYKLVQFQLSSGLFF